MTAAKTSRPATAKGRKADRRAEQAELGEVRFEDWFETPIFDTEPDERLEELTTTGARPLRLAARALVRLDATKGRKRSGGRKADPFADLAATADEQEFTTAVLTEAPAAQPEAPAGVESRPVTARRRRPLKAAPTPEAAAGPGPVAAAAPATPAEAIPAPAPEAIPAPAPAATRRSRPLRAERAPRPVTASATDPAPVPAATPALTDPASGAGLRARAGRALDAWAARELEAQARLERVIVPKRWRS